MRILFVIGDMSFVEPLGVMFLSAIARRRGHYCELAVLSEQNVLERIERRPPDLVCLSVMSVDMAAFGELSRELKRRHPDMPVVVGGPAATFEPDMAMSWPVDAVVRGEGDLAFDDLLAALDAGEPIDTIPNVCTAQKSNPLRPLIDPLDELPHPDRELVYFAGGHLRRLNVKSFMVSRGCAYRCTYCFNSSYNRMYRGLGCPVRRFSVDYIIEEVQQVQTDYGLDFIRFGDDVFAYRVDDWLEEFAEKFPRRVSIPFYCLVRPNLLKPELVQTLKRAGCRSISLSIEAGSEHLRRTVLGRRMDDDVIIEAFRNVHEAGIQVYANAMVGLPGASIADEIQTVELAARCKPVYPSFTVFTPFRGTELGEECARRGLVDQEYPTHTTDRSILNGFSDREKDVQVNIVHLGIFAIRFPRLKRLILERLIYRRPNRLFFAAWYVMKYYTAARHIWPVRGGLRAKLRMAWRALAFELLGKRSSLRSRNRNRNPAAAHPNPTTSKRPAAGQVDSQSWGNCRRWDSNPHPVARTGF